VLASPDGLVVSLAPRRTAAVLPAPEPASEPAAPAAGDRDAEPTTPVDAPAGS